MVSDSDLTAAVVIAILIIVVLVCVWPGYARVRGRDLVGYWAAPGGGLYEIRDMGGRAFAVRGEAAAAAVAGVASGVASGVRGVAVAALGKRGIIELGGRRIDWQGGDSWTRQGVRGAPRLRSP